MPYPRYGETPEATLAAILAMQDAARATGSTAQALQAADAGRRGAQRAGLRAAGISRPRRSGQRVWDLLGRPAPQPCTTAYTISLGTPEAMAAADRQGRAPAAAEDQARRRRRRRRAIAAVRKAAPESELIVDANEAWTPAQSRSAISPPAPRPASRWSSSRCRPGRTTRWRGSRRPIAVCADESVHDRASLTALRDRYDAVNIKLDKTGGLTEALAMADAARALGFDIMVGCMVATSLAMAPAMLLAQQARFVDLDGPLLLAQRPRRRPALRRQPVYPPERRCGADAADRSRPCAMPRRAMITQPPASAIAAIT